MSAYSASLFVFSLLLFAVPGEAFTRKVVVDPGASGGGGKTIYGSADRQGGYTGYQNNDYDHSYNKDLNYSAPSQSAMMESIARAASEGAGHLSKKGPFCYRSVKQIVAAGLGKNLGCIRKTLNDVAAKNAGSDLIELGFRKDMSACRSRGVIRVYRGVRLPGYKPTAGDIYGHSEVMGDDGEYHSFYNTPIPADESSNGRRILTGCYVPDEAKVNSGPASKCANTKRTKYAPGKGSQKKGGQ